MHNTEMYLKKHNSDTNNQITCMQNHINHLYIQYTIKIIVILNLIIIMWVKLKASILLIIKKKLILSGAHSA